MANHELEFHNNHLAVNVKVRQPFYNPLLEIYAKRLGLDWDQYVSDTWDQLTEEFWMVHAPDIARNNGFEGVTSEGNSSGWCVPIYGGNPVERAYLDNVMDEEATTVMKNYFLFRFNIKRLVTGAIALLQMAVADDLQQRDLEFLLEHSLTARVWHHQVFGVAA